MVMGPVSMPFMGFLGLGLGVESPVYMSWRGAEDIAENDPVGGRSATIALHPALLVKA